MVVALLEVNFSCFMLRKARLEVEAMVKLIIMLTMLIDYFVD